MFDLTIAIPHGYSESLPPCPHPEDNGEPLVCIDGLDARICYAASYHASGIACAPSGCWVRKSVFPLLCDAIHMLPQEYSLLIFDAYRPLAVQQALYDRFAAQMRRQHPEYSEAQLAAAVDDYVALPRPDPARPAPHATGGAVDLTICRGGVPLDMGTAFDDFSVRARTAFWEDGPDSVIRQNRRLLYHVMTRAGFVNYSEEWWHYSYGDRLWARTFGQTPIYGLCDGSDVR